uniref:Uncharacterized protein n=1 Tax=Oryza meridionalis TaxID=40149 RepID=A0A0E0ED41_9ORYZ
MDRVRWGPGISLTTSSLASSPASLAMPTSPVCQQPVTYRRVPCRQLSWTSVEITSGTWPISSVESGLSGGDDDARLRKGDDISQPLAGDQACAAPGLDLRRRPR